MEIKSTMLSIYFEACADIKIHIVNLEHIFLTQFSPVSIPSIPVQAPNEIPRAVFQSMGGHSQLTFSNDSAVLNTVYNNGYETDFKKCIDNLKDKVKCIYDFLNILGIRILYVGLSTVLLKKGNNEAKTIEFLTQKINRIKSDIPLYDCNNTMAFVVKDDYFVNISFANVRNNTFIPFGISILNDADQSIEIIVDVNDKHALFLNDAYNSEESRFNEIVDLSFNTIGKIDGLISNGEIKFNE